MTDKDIWRLNRGGHDPHKVYSAYHSAMQHKGSPTVILAKTIKGKGSSIMENKQNWHYWNNMEQNQIDITRKDLE